MPTRDGTPPGGDQLSSSARLGVIVVRDGDGCVWCARPFDDRTPPTREHVIPRVKGGPSWLENEVAACARCNRERGHATPVQWLEEVRLRGRSPRPDVIEAALVRMAERVREHGGARRARKALWSELRKLGRQDLIP
ncbi:HNH endonuclease [Euzebya sp.]|uniref:HNH endonuclease n=1 Tax=Euzebya sp. TaxID=1971409 RepID=UPI003519D35C